MDILCLLQAEETKGKTMEMTAQSTSEIGCGTSSTLSDHGEQDNPAAATAAKKQTECAQSPFSTEEKGSTPFDQDGEPDSDMDSEKEDTVVKLKEDLASKEDNACKDLMESPARPDDSQDTNMNETCDDKEEVTDTDVEMNTNVDTLQKNSTPACKFVVSTADDLDEMMDIGTVDQVEQEAQMKEEEQNKSMDVDSVHSPAISNAGRVKNKKSCLILSYDYLELLMLWEEDTFFSLRSCCPSDCHASNL